MTIISLHRVKNVDQLNDLVEIYKASLPKNEQKPEEQIISMHSDLNYEMLLAMLNDKVIGFAIIYVNRVLPIALLEYMAIAEEYRSQGFGSQLFREALSEIRKDNKMIPLLLEVDSPFGKVADIPNKERRYKFYKALGCNILSGLDYLLPRVNDQPPPAMVVMIHTTTEMQQVDKDILRSWLQDIYVSVYKRSTDDPAITTMLLPLPNKIKLT